MAKYIGFTPNPYSTSSGTAKTTEPSEIWIDAHRDFFEEVWYEFQDERLPLERLLVNPKHSITVGKNSGLATSNARTVSVGLPIPGEVKVNKIAINSLDAGDPYKTGRKKVTATYGKYVCWTSMTEDEVNEMREGRNILEFNIMENVRMMKEEKNDLIKTVIQTTTGIEKIYPSTAANTIDKVHDSTTASNHKFNANQIQQAVVSFRTHTETDTAAKEQSNRIMGYNGGRRYLVLLTEKQKIELMEDARFEKLFLPDEKVNEEWRNLELTSNYLSCDFTVIPEIFTLAGSSSKSAGAALIVGGDSPVQKITLAGATDQMNVVMHKDKALGSNTEDVANLLGVTIVSKMWVGYTAFKPETMKLLVTKDNL